MKKKPELIIVVTVFYTDRKAIDITLTSKSQATILAKKYFNKTNVYHVLVQEITEGKNITLNEYI